VEKKENRRIEVSLYDYEMSKHIATEDYPFYALLMAAMRQADSDNLELLRRAFPTVFHELIERYNASNGKIPSDDIPVEWVIKEIE
jgi:hypothetical protein